jgi:hypothetical protein
MVLQWDREMLQEWLCRTCYLQMIISFFARLMVKFS